MPAVGQSLSTSLQENLLCLVCFDGTAAATIRNSVEVDLFGNSIYRDIVSRAYEYLDKYKEPPGEHIADLLEDRLTKGDKEAQLYADILDGVHALFQRGPNTKFILTQLEGFVRQQTLKGSMIDASEAVQDGNLDLAEELLLKGLKTRLALFNPGTGLKEGLAKAYSHDVRQNILALGIDELDKYEIGPARGEFLLYISGPKMGKSWFCVHCAKQGLLQKMKVCVVTLELSEAQYEQRILQSLFSISRRDAPVQLTRIQVDNLGRLLRFEQDKVKPSASFNDLTSRPKVERRLKLMHAADNLICKEFPAGTLTVRGLHAYLDNLQDQHNFIPDLIILDYPKYMKINADNYRIEAGQLLNDIRGLAQSRNVAVVAPKESNREGSKARLVTGTHSGEDYSAVYTADTVLTYSRTAQEGLLGLARLYVDATRVAERDKFVTLISQAYPIGQYYTGSAPMADNYDGLLELATDGMKQEEPEGDEENE